MTPMPMSSLAIKLAIENKKLPKIGNNKKNRTINPIPLSHFFNIPI